MARAKFWSTFAIALLLRTAAEAAGVASGLPAATQPLGGLPDAVLLDQGTGCPTQTAPCQTSQSPSLRVGQPYQGAVAPTSPFLYQLWWNTGLTPAVLSTWDGAQWVTVGTLNLTTHTWSGLGAIPTGTVTAAQLVGSIPAAKLLLPKYGAGCTLSNDVTTPNTTIDIAPCHTAEDVTYAVMQNAASFTKNMVNWAAGSANGCLDAGVVANSTWYYIFEIATSAGASVDYLCSTSYTAPTMPATYTLKRYIGPIRTDSTAKILAFTQLGNEFVWSVPVRDVAAATCTTSATSATLASLPNGYKVQANLRASVVKAADAPILLLSSLDEADTAPGTPVGNYTIITPVLGIAAAGQTRVGTSTAQQIRQRCSVTGASINVVTVGWTDPQIAWPH